ncbi:juvenile spermatogonial depletion [Coccidioides immitis H538.4]|uniref:Juvenile spermatogonial depletion n=1 Tax=Coccidioides immitis H538.4 TaxID=396776 RepID=A0A0J8RLE9_COCIT|nr:juvenile spermatogonial depletion [Coccidioides immitis H538.4]
MPGRRSNVLNNLKNDAPKSKSGGGKRKLGRGLDALAIAEREYPQKSGVKLHRLGDDDDDHDSRRKRGFRQDADDDEAPSKRRKTEESDLSEDGGSDSEGNEWRIGQVDSENDSEIASDEAFGSSDEERFEGFTFRASSTRKGSRAPSKPGRKNQSVDLSEGERDGKESPSEDELEDELEDDLGDDAVDLAAAWDMNAEESEEEKRKSAAKARKENGKEDAESDDESSTGTESDGEEDDESDLSLSEDDGATDTRGLSKLQRFVNALKSEDSDEKKAGQSTSITLQGSEPTEFGLISSRKLTVADLLPTISDSRMKGSLKHLHVRTAEKKSKSGGIPGKLDVPLSKREQDRLDRTAAYQKSKETLDRWIDTVKANRRAEHLSFPLPETASIQNAKVTDSKPRTDLETTIQNILVESGLASSNGKDAEDRIQEFEKLQTNKLSIEELQARRNELRRARELLFREEVRAKRIKKIKSKSYRRVHRKERERMEQRERDALAAAGVDMEEEDRERADRLRAEMRMGAKHRESKWAKSVKQTGRGAWDEDARAGIAEQARRREELQRRIEGKRVHEEGYTGSSGSESEEDDIDPFDNEAESEDEVRRLQRKLEKLEGDGAAEEELTGPHAKLLSMKFMRNAEAARKAANDAEIKKLNRQFAGEESASEIEDDDGGRRRFGKSDQGTSNKELPVAKRQEFEEPTSDDENLPEADDDIDIRVDGKTNGKTKQRAQAASLRNKQRAQTKSKPNDADTDINPWLSEGTKRSRKKKGAVDGSMDITLIENTGAAKQEVESKQNGSLKEKAATQQRQKPGGHEDDVSDDEESRVPILLQNEELVKRAFAGDEVLEAFTKEKLETIEDEGDKIVEDTLPGWGSWTGSGLTKKEKREAKAQRSFKTVEGIKPANRKDAKLDRVIINEKRVRKNTKYLASQLPHPFESRQQYERSLRVPIGPEWTTKEVFQDSTKPRLMVKQGVIKPIQRPHV